MKASTAQRFLEMARAQARAPLTGTASEWNELAGLLEEELELQGVIAPGDAEFDALQAQFDELMGRAVQVKASLEAGPVHTDVRGWAAGLAEILLPRRS